MSLSNICRIPGFPSMTSYIYSIGIFPKNCSGYFKYFQMLNGFDTFEILSLVILGNTRPSTSDTPRKKCPSSLKTQLTTLPSEVWNVFTVYLTFLEEPNAGQAFEILKQRRREIAAVIGDSQEGISLYRQEKDFNKGSSSVPVFILIPDTARSERGVEIFKEAQIARERDANALNLVYRRDGEENDEQAGISRKGEARHNHQGGGRQARLAEPRGRRADNEFCPRRHAAPRAADA